MATLMGTALGRRVESKPPGLFPRQSSSANSTATPNSDDIASCTSTCMIDAFSVVPECNYDMPCMCAKDDFRTSVAACMKKTCNFGGPGYDEILQNVLDQCVDCAYGGLSCTNSTVSGSGDDPLGITIPSTRASASGGTKSSSTLQVPAGGSDDDEKSSTPVAAIAGGVVGGLVVIALVGVLIWWMARKNKRTNATVALPTTPTGEVKFNQPPSQPQVPPHLAYNQPQQPQHQVPTPYGTDFAPPAMYHQQQTYAPQQPNADLGYVPPSQFMQYAPPPGAYPTPGAGGGGGGGGGVSVSNVSTGSSAPILSTGSYRPPSSDASSSSGAPPFNPYAPNLQPRPLTLHTDNGAPSAWPRDEKRPLNVMSADAAEARPMSPGDGLPAYQR